MDDKGNLISQGSFVTKLVYMIKLISLKVYGEKKKKKKYMGKKGEETSIE